MSSFAEQYEKGEMKAMEDVFGRLDLSALFTPNELALVRKAGVLLYNHGYADATKRAEDLIRTVQVPKS